jgi:hypothetical protein
MGNGRKHQALQDAGLCHSGLQNITKDRRAKWK